MRVRVRVRVGVRVRVRVRARVRVRGDGRDGREPATGKMSIAEQVRTGYHPEEY